MLSDFILILLFFSLIYGGQIEFFRVAKNILGAINFLEKINFMWLFIFLFLSLS